MRTSHPALAPLLLLGIVAVAACSRSETLASDAGSQPGLVRAAEGPLDAGRRLRDEEVSSRVAEAARRVLNEHAAAPYGTLIAIEVDGVRYVARIEQHHAEPGEPGRPAGAHKGVTLYAPSE
jgi:hypothetical protein